MQAALEFAPAPIADIDEELYDAVMAVNAKSTDTDLLRSTNPQSPSNRSRYRRPRLTDLTVILSPEGQSSSGWVRRRS
jgi:hypothetical protein